MRSSSCFLGLWLGVVFASSWVDAGQAAEGRWPGAAWPEATPTAVGMDARLLEEARDYALKGNGSGLVVRHGQVAIRWGKMDRRYGLKSSTKAIGFTAVGLALADRKFESLADLASDHHSSFGVPPESNRKTGWLGRITLLHLATQTAGRTGWRSA